jgi:hypothetical protein
VAAAVTSTTAVVPQRNTLVEIGLAPALVMPTVALASLAVPAVAMVML